MKLLRPVLPFVIGLSLLEAGPNTSSPPPMPAPPAVSQPLVPIAVPKRTRVSSGGLGIGTATPRAAAPRTVDMKMLVIAVDGTEPSYAAITAFLKSIGIPYQAVLAKTQPLPVLNDANKGFYQGIILVTGNLGVCDPTCRSALIQADWDRLDQYAVNFGVRTISYYTFPEARYGLSYVGAVATSTASPQNATYTVAGNNFFKYLRPQGTLKIANAYTYLGAVFPVAGATSTPLINLPGGIVGNQFLDSDGSESVAMMMDNNPDLQHSLLLNYGLISWVTRGKFLGSRRIYVSPQIDDLFLPNDQFLSSNPACVPAAFNADPTYDPAVSCPTLRISAADLTALVAWEDNIRANPFTPTFRSAFAFNGFGHTVDADAPPNDPLMREAVRLGSKLFQVNHTWDHEHLDCYQPVPNSGICTPATYAQSQTELQLNIADANAIALPFERQAMVTPNISGLNNPNFVRAAREAGIRYFVTDASRPEGAPPSPNAGIWNPYQLIMMIPRWANNIFYNISRPTLGATGSLPDEFNHFYGPNGVFRIGGTGGPPFFTSNQTYAQIMDFESDGILRKMLKYEIYPVMFHQGNVYRYNGVNSVYTDLFDKVFQKYNALVRLPVLSLSETDTGAGVIERMLYDASGVSGTWVPGVSITLTVTRAANVPVTGVCAAGCQNYAVDQQSKIRVSPGQTVVVPAP